MDRTKMIKRIINQIDLIEKAKWKIQSDIDDIVRIIHKVSLCDGEKDAFDVCTSFIKYGISIGDLRIVNLFAKSTMFSINIPKMCHLIEYLLTKNMYGIVWKFLQMAHDQIYSKQIHEKIGIVILFVKILFSHIHTHTIAQKRILILYNNLIIRSLGMTLLHIVSRDKAYIDITYTILTLKDFC